MNIQVLLAMLGFLSAPAMAQVATTELRDRQSGGTQLIDAAQGPVNLTWGQNRQLANAADYKTTIAELDQNGDGVLTLAEIPEAHALHSEFRLVDADHDGKVTAEELGNWR
jgi:Ca2+-binding EF-hand superfamily protein